MFLFLIVSSLLANLRLIDGKDIRISSLKGYYPDSIIGFPVLEESKIRSGKAIAYFELCSNNILRLEKFTVIEYNPKLRYIELQKGQLTIFTDETTHDLCLKFDINKGSIRYGSYGSIEIMVDDSLYHLEQGQIITSAGLFEPEKRWYSRYSKDADYLIFNLKEDNIPSQTFNLDYPSRQEKLFSYSSSGSGGIATYKDNRYYYASLILQARIWELKMAYDFWLAISSSGNFYDEAWDEWDDLVSHIEYIQLFEPNDPFYFRIGLLKNLNYGYGLLMSNYNNSVFLPFDRLSGIETRLSLEKVKSGLFVNDISYPRVIGGETQIDITDKFAMGISFISDLDLLAHIEDSDNDSYPDEIDPEPNIANDETDSIITANNINSLDEVDNKQIHTFELSGDYDILTNRDLNTSVSGAIAMHSQLGTGISFPNMSFSYRWFSISAGLDLQSPNFDGWIFGRNYETEKARFIIDADSNTIITTRVDELSDENNWLYGWNNSFSLRIPRYVELKTRFRDIYRGNHNDRKFSLRLKNKYPFSDIFISSNIFIENRNFNNLFKLISDGSSWGAELEFRAHETIEIKISYREVYEDRNLNDVITSSEIKRNFDGSATVDFDYWWDKFIEWRRAKKAEKKASESRTN
ncbi:MAG: hypothetical protein ACLFSQ_02630 [Candidatus Zixiibacteriota bacterium]